MTRVTDFGVLDNPIWFSAQTAHRSLVRINGRACRYADDVSPFAAVETATQAAFDDLAALVAPQERNGVLHSRPDQCAARVAGRAVDAADTDGLHRAATRGGGLVPDVGRARCLRDAGTHRGDRAGTVPSRNHPHGTLFRREGSWAIDRHGRRATAAGRPDRNQRRLHRSRFSRPRICAALVRYLLQLIFADSRTPFLHVKPENEAAIKLYEALGFTIRRTMQLTLLARE